MAEWDFAVGADDADGEDGCVSGFSGVAEGLVATMLTMRVLDQPSGR
jgi:hypothetical protein